jgi:hypothetical protein
VKLDRTPFNRARMKRNASDGLFAKSSILILRDFKGLEVLPHELVKPFLKPSIPKKCLSK